MTVRTGATIHFSEGDVHRHWHPGSDECHAYGSLKFGAVATVFFDGPAQIDEVIAELVALRAEMTGEPASLAPCGHARNEDGECPAACDAPASVTA